MLKAVKTRLCLSHLSLTSSCDGAHSLPSVVYEMSYKEHSADSETSVLYTFTYCLFKHAIVSCWRGTFDPWVTMPLVLTLNTRPSACGQTVGALVTDWNISHRQEYKQRNILSDSSVIMLLVG